MLRERVENFQHDRKEDRRELEKKNLVVSFFRGAHFQMEQEKKHESPSPLPIIPRLDRIDRLLQFLEEKHCSVRKQNSSSSAIRQS